MEQNFKNGKNFENFNFFAILLDLICNISSTADHIFKKCLEFNFELLIYTYIFSMSYCFFEETPKTDFMTWTPWMGDSAKFWLNGKKATQDLDQVTKSSLRFVVFFWVRKFFVALCNHLLWIKKVKTTSFLFFDASWIFRLQFTMYLYLIFWVNFFWLFL